MPNPAGFFTTLFDNVRYRWQLSKVPLCLLIGGSTLFGTLLANPTIKGATLLCGCAVFILALGAASLNSLQEYHLDRELLRTSKRPLPKGLLTPRQAGWQAFTLCLAGLLLLVVATKTIWPFITAVMAVMLYNGLYTPLKQKTVLAIIPGALCGALPPYIGWLGGGGEAFGYPALLLVALFVLWQIPHFWLVLLNFKAEYAGSRLPHFLQLFREETVKRFFITWLGALVLVMMMFLGLPVPLGFFWRAMIVVNGCLLLGAFIYGLALAKKTNYRTLFIILNAALLVHMVLLVVGRIAGGIER